eukprot:796998-Prorocentrum_minimum.AAC.1
MQEVWVYSDDGPIRCRRRRYILLTDQSVPIHVIRRGPDSMLRHRTVTLDTFECEVLGCPGAEGGPGGTSSPCDSLPDDAPSGGSGFREDGEARDVLVRTIVPIVGIIKGADLARASKSGRIITPPALYWLTSYSIKSLTPFISHQID